MNTPQARPVGASTLAVLPVRLLPGARWLLALAVFLAFAPAAKAEQGVVGYFPTPMTPLGLAVNSGGTGGGDPGDVYVSHKSSDHGQAGGRILQYSASGEVKRIWGIDVVDVGPGNADEVQLVRIQATGGSFTLRYGDETTDPIPFDAAAQQVEDELNALASIGGVGGEVTVEGGPGNATGSDPYRVQFGGSQVDVNHPAIVAEQAALTGPGSSSFVATRIQGGTGFEVCDQTQDVCQEPTEASLEAPVGVAGAAKGINSLAVNETSGDVYARVGIYNRVNHYSATGEFRGSFGLDTVFIGPGDGLVNESQRLTILGAGGTFTLSLQLTPFGGTDVTTLPVPAKAPAAVLEAAINEADPMKALRASVSVTGGPGGTGGSPYVIAFNGTLAGDDVSQLTANPVGLTGGGAANVLTLQNGGSAEVCTETDICKTGVTSALGGAISGVAAGAQSGLAVVPAGAPNQGNVLIADDVQRRISEFTENGEFVRAFGGDVVIGGGAGFEVCPAVSSKSCKAGAGSTGVGQFSGLVSAAADASGTIYTVENGGNRRVQKFVPAGGLNLTPGVLAVPERQSLTVNASAGQFRLTVTDFEGTTGTVNTHGTSIGSPSTLTGLKTTAGEFLVGQHIANGTGIGSSCLTQGTRITEIIGTTVSLSRPVTCSNTGPNPAVFSNDLNTTGNLPASATAPEIAAALNTLAPITDKGGSVSVTGANPFTITFGGGGAAGVDFAPIGGSSGTVPLSGGIGAGADQATVTILNDGGPSGAFDGDVPMAIDIDSAGRVFVAKQFANGAAICENGALSFVETRIEELSLGGGDIEHTSKPCTEDSIGGNSVIVGIQDDLKVSDETGEAYLGHGPNIGSPFIPGRVYIFGEVGEAPEVVLDPPAGIGATGVTVSGTVDPNGVGPISHPNPSLTRYRVEYREVGTGNWETYISGQRAGSGESPVPISIGIGGLTPATQYEARVVATKPFGFVEVITTTSQFTTLAGPPRINAFYPSDVTASSATLHSAINPGGAETTYRFEYGTTPAYGKTTAPMLIPASSQPVAVQAVLNGLDAVTHHFRVVATNAEGTAISSNQSFGFYPEHCPNSTVRQQTGAAHLPDCRAYELVSPDFAGTAALQDGRLNSPYASNPPRFGFVGTSNTIPGPWNPPNAFSGDPYLATRTSTGWQTTYIGGDAHETILGAQPDWVPQRTWTDLGMDRFLQWRTPLGLNEDSMGAYLSDSQGDVVDRWPTNVEDVPHGTETYQEGGFFGDAVPSADFGHYFFSSSNISFAPGGQTSGMGSAYDNDTAAGTVKVASKLPGGGDIPREPGVVSDDVLQLPAASRDGSHVLMSASGKGVCGRVSGVCPSVPDMCAGACRLQPGHLYMRVDGMVTIDVSHGHVVTYEGMTRDGGEVVFTSREDLTEDGSDDDTSTDLYVWRELGDSITRLSTGSGVPLGNTDLCDGPWIARCDVEVVHTIRKPSLFALELLPTDDRVAAEDGSVYFYSPEQLAGTDAIPGRRNLYVARDGSVRHVAVLEEGKPITRIQVSPDGDHAAFLTESRATLRNTAGFEQMYLYDADADELVCVSCHPAGASPTDDVEASRNGRFMTDDGRAFFTTSDALVSRDTNNANDVYEYVDAKAQLITTGVVASTGSEVGLSGVSADGLDVYFTTVEPLVPNDRNGGFVRFYDARTNGGFAAEAPIAPCAAADECHSGSSRSPEPRRLGSTGSLESSGNVPPKARGRAPRKKRCKSPNRAKQNKRCKGKKRGNGIRRVGR